MFAVAERTKTAELLVWYDLPGAVAWKKNEKIRYCHLQNRSEAAEGRRWLKIKGGNDGKLHSGFCIGADAGANESYRRVDRLPGFDRLGDR